MASYVYQPGKNPGKPHTVRWFFDGKQRERSFAKKTDANRWKAEVEHKINEGTFVDTKLGNRPFREYAMECIEQRSLSRNSYRRYEGVLRNHLIPELGNIKLRDLANNRELVKSLLLTRLPAKGLGRSQCEIAQVLIMSTMAEAQRSGLINGHRLSGIKLPAKVTKTDFLMPTHAQCEALAEALGEWGLAVWLARGCGLRLGEALAVKLSDFRDEGYVLRVHEQVASGTTLGPLKHRKTGEFRDVPVPAYVWHKVNDHLTEYDDGGELLLHGVNTPYVAESTFNHRWTKAKELAGLPQSFRFHDLRHAFASIALAGRVPVTDVSRWLGHKNINVTYSIYAHLIPSSEGAARDVLDDEWSEAA